MEFDINNTTTIINWKQYFFGHYFPEHALPMKRIGFYQNKTTFAFDRHASKKCTSLSLILSYIIWGLQGIEIFVLVPWYKEHIFNTDNNCLHVTPNSFREWQKNVQRFLLIGIVKWHFHNITKQLTRHLWYLLNGCNCLTWHCIQSHNYQLFHNNHRALYNEWIHFISPTRA